MIGDKFQNASAKGIMEEGAAQRPAKRSSDRPAGAGKYMREDIEKAFEQWLYEIDKLLMAGEINPYLGGNIPTCKDVSREYKTPANIPMQKRRQR